MDNTTLSLALAALAFTWAALSAVLTGMNLLALRRMVQAYHRRRKTKCHVFGDEGLAERLRERGFAALPVFFFGDDFDKSDVVVLVDPTAEEVTVARGRTIAPILVLTRTRLDVALGDDLLLCNHEVRLVSDLAVIVEGR